MPTTPVACGGGAAGELQSDVVGIDGKPIVFGAVTPAWHRGSSDAPGIIMIVTSDPSFSLFAWGATTSMIPNVGDQPSVRGSSIRLGDSFFGGTTHLVIDDSDGTVMPVCIAGRFEVEYDNDLHGKLAGWFRTR